MISVRWKTLATNELTFLSRTMKESSTTKFAIGLGINALLTISQSNS